MFSKTFIVCLPLLHCTKVVHLLNCLEGPSTNISATTPKTSKYICNHVCDWFFMELVPLCLRLFYGITPPVPSETTVVLLPRNSTNFLSIFLPMPALVGCLFICDKCLSNYISAAFICSC